MNVQGRIVTTQTVTGNAHQTYIDKSTPYTGPYTVTPSEQAQILQTSGKRMTENVTIEAVPWVRPQGEITLTENGEHNVEQYETATVAVPLPHGDIEITQNGQANVYDYATATVNVPQGVFPAGTQQITQNGEYDVTDKVGVDVQVPQGFVDKWFEIHHAVVTTQYESTQKVSCYNVMRDFARQISASINKTAYVVCCSCRRTEYAEDDFGFATEGVTQNNIYFYGRCMLNGNWANIATTSPGSISHTMQPDDTWDIYYYIIK